MKSNSPSSFAERFSGLNRGGLSVLCLITFACVAQAELIPPQRLFNWQPGITVGVPGGIDQYLPGGANQRTNLINVTLAPYNADTTGATDASTAIQNAINAANAGDVVYLPAGTYRVNGCLSVGYKKNITIRGAGPTQTLLNYYSSWGPCIYVGGDANYQWNQPNLAIGGSPTQGATVLNVGDTSALSVYPNGGIGCIAQVGVANQNDNTAIQAGAVPVVSVANYGYMRRQKLRIVAKTATTITVFPPLAFDLPASLTPKLQLASFQAEMVGVEDLKVDMANSSTPNGGVQMSQAYGCWARNVTVVNVANYHIVVADSVQCELRRCDARHRQIEGTNGAALLMGCSGGCLIEDNIFGQNFPVFEINGGSCGNVFAYNFVHNSSVFGAPAAAIDTNHGPHNSYNLYEGNITPNFQCDGYFGGASDETLFRNWITGACSTTVDIRSNCVALNRFTRNYSIVGNILGTEGLTAFLYGFGYPNMGNSGFSGSAQPSTGDFWADWTTMKAAAPGTGPGANGFQEMDLDVQATTILKGNYNSNNRSIPTTEPLGGDTLPASLFRSSKPAFFASLSWPPFDPQNAGTLSSSGFDRIPAGYRYVHGTDPSGGGAPTPPAGLRIVTP